MQGDKEKGRQETGDKRGSPVSRSYLLTPTFSLLTPISYDLKNKYVTSRRTGPKINTERSR
jgi:hypothetical protein